MPKTKSLKELADDYGVHPTTIMRWLHNAFPSWYNLRKKGIPKMKAERYRNKCTYNPKEIKLIYEMLGDPFND